LINWFYNKIDNALGLQKELVSSNWGKEISEIFRIITIKPNYEEKKKDR